MKKAVLFALLLLLMGCTENKNGNTCHVSFYQEGTLVDKWIATDLNYASGGVKFTDFLTNEKVIMTGDLVITCSQD